MLSGSNKQSAPRRVVVLVYIVRFPLGGMAWHYLQYAMGLKRLGHEVLMLEDSEDYPCCYDPSRHVTDTDPAYGLAFAKNTLDRTGLADDWAYHDAHTGRWHGPRRTDATAFCRSADLLINISGANPVRPWLEQVPRRVLIDTDPVFEQVRQLTVPHRRERAAMHNAFFTFGECVGTPGWAVPDDGWPWRPTRQPVVLDAWPVTPVKASAPLTTVMQWDSYPAREYNGKHYGLKAQSFDPYLTLPGRCADTTLELALGSPDAPRQRLLENGWRLSDPIAATLDPWSYQSFIQGSLGEFSVAKHGYVAGHTGWFSERTACYLASGRPAVVQDTGFSGHLPTGKGLFAFKSPDEAAVAIEAIRSDPQGHAVEARRIAETEFNAQHVLTRLLNHLDEGLAR